MPFFRKTRLFILLIGVIVLIVLVGYSVNDRENASVPEQIVNDTVGFVQNSIHTPIQYVTGVFENIDDFMNTYNENQILREQLAESKGLVYETQELREENETLRSNLDLSESLRDYEPIAANVISRSPERWMEQVTIDRGEQHGVEPNMVVMTAEGMIGTVQSTSQFHSKIRLLTGFDQLNRISAAISVEGGDDVFGMVEGFDEETDSLQFRIIEDAGATLEEGDLVVSSGLGGVFPEGLPVGTVNDVVSDQYGLTRTALVTPAADLHEIDNVIVADRTSDEVQNNSSDPVEEEEG